MADRIYREESPGDRCELIPGFAEERGWIITVTGATDIVIDGHSTAVVENGHPMMGREPAQGARRQSQRHVSQQQWTICSRVAIND